MAEAALALARQDRARERSERERRRGIVARLRWIESNLTAAEIVTALRRMKPPIFASIRTVERDFTVIREDTRRYLSPGHFDAPFEISAALMRHEMIESAEDFIGWQGPLECAEVIRARLLGDGWTDAT